MDESPGVRLLDAFVRPGLQLGPKRIVDDEYEIRFSIADQHAAVLRAFAERQNVECRRRAAQRVHAEHGQPQRRAQPRDEFVGGEGEVLFQRVHKAAAGTRRHAARGGDLLRGDRFDLVRAGLAHCRLPASSKMGMYMRITMTPITMPITPIRRGSNRRVNQSTQRLISSS